MRRPRRAACSIAARNNRRTIYAFFFSTMTTAAAAWNGNWIRILFDSVVAGAGLMQLSDAKCAARETRKMLPIRRKRALTPLRSKYAPVPYECTPLIVRSADSLNQPRGEGEKEGSRDSVIRNNEALLPFYRAVGTRRDVELSLSGKILSPCPLFLSSSSMESRRMKQSSSMRINSTREQRDSRSLSTDSP